MTVYLERGYNHNEELKSLTRYRFDKVKERAKLKMSISWLSCILFPELKKTWSNTSYGIGLCFAVGIHIYLLEHWQRCSYCHAVFKVQLYLKCISTIHFRLNF